MKEDNEVTWGLVVFRDLPVNDDHNNDNDNNNEHH